MREYFSSVYGNDRSKMRLGDAAVKGKLPHAFLLLGPEGSGKRTFAKELAMALNCEELKNEKLPLPCKRCNTCRRIREGNFTDITFIRRAEDKATIGVDEVRHHREDMVLSANESDHKIYIIEEADRLTENAQNALLTVLEEPPASVFIILLCESGDKILTTIKSRVQTIRMQRFEFDELKKVVFELSANAARFAKGDPAAADGLIMSADGRIGKAIKLFSEDESKRNEDERGSVERIINVIRHKLPYKELYSAVSEFPKSRVDLVFTLELLTSAIRDLILLKFDKTAPLLFYTSREDASAAAKDISTKKLLSVYESVRSALSDTDRNVGISAITADLAAKIKLL